MEKKIGIEETKDLVAFMSSFVVAGFKAYEDKRITIGDVAEFADAVSKLPAALVGITQIPDELRDLDEDELNALIEVVSKEFDDSAVLEDVEDLVMIAKAAISLYKRRFS